MSDPLIALTNVTAGYAAPVVGPVSLTVGPGEIVGLCGPNGSGKSTVLAAITRSARIFSGEIERRPGLRVALQRQHHPRVAELPLVGRDMLKLAGAKTRPVPPILEPLQCGRLGVLSGGQVQLFFVWAAVGGPAELVILDEPTNNMDPGVVSALVSILGGLDSDRGALVVSHDHAFLEHVSTRMVELAPHGS
jgi:ATPase subunit of ABC transporter with duplicated ATPase domains